MKVYKAVDLPEFETRIFLAGSIEMGKAEDWQTRVTKHFGQFDDVVILNPRRDDWDSSWEQSILNDQFRRQVEWELEMMEVADIVAMYFDPETKSPITLMELGLLASSGKLVVYCPHEFWRKGNVDVVCARYGAPVFENYEDWLEEIDWMRKAHRSSL